MSEPLFSFPREVNEVSARLVAGGVVIMAVLTLAFDLRWLTLVLAYGFVARVLSGPKLSPLGQLVTKVITPALPYESRMVPGPPKRFAQLIGAGFSTAAVVLTYGADRFDLAQGVLAVLLVPAALEAVVGFCAGCWLFGQLMRAGVIPAEVCDACGDIWGPRPQRADASV